LPLKLRHAKIITRLILNLALPDSRMKISRQPAVYRAFCESDFEMRGAKTHPDGRNTAPSASIIKAIGDPTTAEIVRLYEKYCERAEAKRSCDSPNLRNQATGSPLLTIFITDLQFPQPWKGSTFAQGIPWSWWWASLTASTGSASPCSKTCCGATA
jgi:hypothetical protein